MRVRVGRMANLRVSAQLNRARAAFLALLGAACAVIACAAGAAAQSEAIGGPDAAARFRAERFEFLLEQAASGAQTESPSLPDQASAAARIRASHGVRRAIFRFMLLREDVCARGLVDDEQCGVLELPDWASESALDAIAPGELQERLDWIDEVSEPFVEAGCAAGDLSLTEGDRLIFCTARVDD